jgi:hypothetical protein
MSATDKHWIVAAGRGDSGLEEYVHARVQERIAAGKYSAGDIAYIAKMSARVTADKLDVSYQTLEKLRRLCQLWDVDLRPGGISSHRKILGPAIVAAKRLFYPVLRVFMKDFIRQQRSFNAAVISVLAELSQGRDAPRR